MTRTRPCTPDRIIAIEAAAEEVGIIGNIVAAIGTGGKALPDELEWLAGHLERCHVAILDALR
ncbi:hypothetical protein [Tanticharoenia sakaeratensis]|uniref:Uncharacterized protein n=1 Tax=Tanticharoenia sakaeratensis NBRC 103193 TaxID=1231623 RepID=A0A0D6MP44_9PROT|nr:hypothetical protein [Tanticharoenia sakaeratensis]GAN55457.1 hypothetical protein Tasa_048_082 [Tanticharoenia sakaeratensis NBRC 103193]GBQ22020.1 hypothetical protein AA103193_1929 [Tanticharoenia sakaeratensis NBRC 103193]